VAELAALLLTDDAIRAEPVPDIGAALELLGVAGSVLEGAALAQLGRALTAARVVAGDLARLRADAPRTAALRVDPPPKELEQRLTVSLDPDGQVQDGASRTPSRGPAARCARRARVWSTSSRPCSPRLTPRIVRPTRPSRCGRAVT